MVIGKCVEIQRDRWDLTSARVLNVESVDCCADTCNSLAEQSGPRCPRQVIKPAFQDLQTTRLQIEHDKALRTLDWKPKAEVKLSMTRVRNPDDVWQLVCLFEP
jgi:hypothetical protein